MLHSATSRRFPLALLVLTLGLFSAPQVPVSAQNSAAPLPAFHGHFAVLMGRPNLPSYTTYALYVVDTVGRVQVSVRSTDQRTVGLGNNTSATPLPLVSTSD